MSLSISRPTRLLLRISFLATFAESMLIPIYAAFTERVGGSVLDAGIAFAAFSIATGAMVGAVGTRPVFQRHLRLFLAIGLWTSTLCDVGYALVWNKWQLFALQTAAGLATGLVEPAWDSAFGDCIDEPSARHWSIWAGGTHMFAGLAALAGGLVVAHLSFTVLFLMMAAVDAAAAIMASLSGASGTDSASKELVSHAHAIRSADAASASSASTSAG